MEKKALSSGLKIWFGVADFGFNMMTNVETFYWNNFLTNVAGFSVALTGTVATVATTVDACLSWIYGGIINALPAGKYGRYRTWFIKINWLVPFLYVFQFLRVSKSDTVSAIVCCVAAIVSHVVWNMSYCANLAMIAVASGGDSHNRAVLASNRATWNNLAGLVYSYVMVGLAAILPEALKSHEYAVAAFLFAVLMVLGMVVHFKITDGYEEIEDPNAPKVKSKTVTPIDMFRGLVKNPHLIMLIIADLAKWICKFLVGSAAVYYFVNVMGQPRTTLANYILFGNICCIIAAYGTRYIAKVFGNRKSFMLALAWMVVTQVVAYLNWKNSTMVFWFMVVMMFGYGLAYATSPALFADCSVYSKWKTGKDATGFITGLQNLPLKAAVMVKSILLNSALAAAGYEAYRVQIMDATKAQTLAEFTQTLPDTLKKGVAGAFCLFSALFCVIGLVCMLLGYKLTDEKLAQYQAEIDAREAA